MAIRDLSTVRSVSTAAPIAPVARDAITLGGLGELMVAVALLVMLASLAR